MSALDVRARPPTMRAMPSRVRPPLLALIVALALPACGLLGVGEEPIDFRTYELRGLPYAQTAPIVVEVVRGYLTEIYRGVSLSWDPGQRQLRSDPVYSPDGRRRLTLYAELHPRPGDDGVDLDMLALVETLDNETFGAVRWIRPQMDVLLEQRLHEAMVAAVVEVRAAP